MTTLPLRRRAWLAAIAGLVAGALAIALAPAHWLFVAPAATDAQREPGVRWACPMMDYIGETRGDGRCPVCGMALERITAGALTAEQRRRMAVETAPVAMGPAVITVRAYGAARWDQRTRRSVIPRVAGRIVRRHPATLHHGGMVAEGDPLFDLFSPQVLAAEGELAAAVSAQEPQLAAAVRARFARWNLAAVADAVVAGKALVDTVTIVSPYAGRIIPPGGDEAMAAPRDLVQVGAEVMAEQPLLDVVDPAAFIAVVHVPEAQARFLRVGDAVSVASDDAGDLPEVDARINWLAPDLSLATRTREVQLHLSDPRGRVLAGALISARIHAALGPDLQPADPADEATWGRFAQVPKSAVLSTGVRDVAWKLVGEDGGAQRFAPVSLALGPRIEDPDGGDRYIVRAGLAAGDVVATQGAFLIDSQAQLVGSPSLLFPAGAGAGDPHAEHR